MDEKLFKKIEKLFALGDKNGNSCEAEAALRKAYELMQQNGVSIEDIGKISRDEKLGSLGETDIADDPKGYKKWEVTLLFSVTKLFDCSVLCTNYRHVTRKQYTIVGREGNRITAKLMYEFLHETIRKEARKVGGRYASSRTAYATGAVNTLHRRVREMKDSTPKTDAWGIVTYDEVQQYIKQMHSSAENKCLTAGAIRDAVAYYHGRKAGEKMSLNRQFGLTGIEAK